MHSAAVSARRALGAAVAAVFLALAVGLAAAPAGAAEAPLAAANPVLEKQMLEIAAELRCLVCQNQTIADSNADLAVDLRRQVREMLERGESKRAILDYMTARYGDFVLYRPPLKDSTAMLWFGPALLLLGGVVTLVVVLRRRARLPDDRFESDDDLADAGAPNPHP